MADNIILAGSLVPGTTDTPLDARARVASLSAVASIDNPFVGMIFYCTATGKHYKVKSLKAKTIGSASVQNAAVNDYEALPDASDLAAISAQIGEFETAANAILGEET